MAEVYRQVSYQVHWSKFTVEWLRSLLGKEVIGVCMEVGCKSGEAGRYAVKVGCKIGEVGRIALIVGCNALISLNWNYSEP